MTQAPEPDAATASTAEAGGRHDSGPRRRQRKILLAVALVLGIGGATAVGIGVTEPAGQPPVRAVGSTALPALAPRPPAPTRRKLQPPPAVPLPRSRPVSLRIPGIGVQSRLLSLGLNPDRTVQAPKDFDLAGWYDKGPTPGEAGASVILGHIDSFRGPAVFYRLSHLQPGDRIYVTRHDGTTATFVVDARRQYPKSRFPAEKVYGAVGNPELRLITCGGAFDNQKLSYLDNIVVYAHLARKT